MKIHIEKENKTIAVNYTGKASGLLKKLKINPAVVLVARNGSLINEDGKLKNSDEVKIMSVISGG